MIKKKKKLGRSGKDRILGGVLGGVAEYFKVDATLLRVAWLVLVSFTGFIPGIIAYIAAIFIVPKR